MMNQTKRLLITVAVAALYLAPIGTVFSKEKKKQESSDSGGHIKAALEFVDQRQYEQAIAEFTAALQASPDNAFAIYQNRGAMYIAVNKYPEAQADYAKAIEMKPQDERSYLGRGQAEIYLGQWDAAIADLSKAIELKPDDADAYGFRGYSYSKLSDWAKALPDYDKFLAAKPNDQVALERRAEANRSQQKYAEAIADYTKALEQMPPDAVLRSAALYKGRAYTYHLMNEIQKAAADYRKSHELNPADNDALARAMGEEQKLATPTPPPPPPTPTPTPTPAPAALVTPFNIGIGIAVLLVIVVLIALIARKKRGDDALRLR